MRILLMVLCNLLCVCQVHSMAEHTDILRRRGLVGVPRLHAAAWLGSVEMCRVLLERGAVVERTCETTTPFILAAARGHVEVCKLLHRWGAKINRCNFQ